MRKLSMITAATAFVALAIPAAASAQSQYGYNAPVQNVQCERQRKDDKTAGAVVGAIAGGLLGGALGNEIHDNQSDRNVGRYGRHGYSRRGYRGYSRGYRKNDSNDGEVIVGALLGAVIGGVAGSKIADGSSSNCAVAGPSYNQGSYNQGGIPRTTDGLYGGPEVMGGSTYPNTPVRTYPTSGGTYPERSSSRTTYPVPTYPAPQPAPAREECRTVYSETRLPDGRTVSDPVTACRQGANAPWEIVATGDIGGDNDPYRY